MYGFCQAFGPYIRVVVEAVSMSTTAHYDAIYVALAALTLMVIVDDAHYSTILQI